MSYALVNWGIEVLFTTETREVFPKTSTPDLGFTQLSIEWLLKPLSHLVKMSKYEANHWTPSAAEYKYAWSRYFSVFLHAVPVYEFTFNVSLTSSAISARQTCKHLPRCKQCQQVYNNTFLLCKFIWYLIISSFLGCKVIHNFAIWRRGSKRSKNSRLFKIFNCIPCSNGGGRDSSVSTATRYGLDGPEIESWWGRDFSHLSRPTLGPRQPPIQWVPGLSRG